MFRRTSRLHGKAACAAISKSGGPCMLTAAFALRARSACRRLPLLAVAALFVLPPVPAGAQVITANPIMFVTQTPVANFGSGTGAFGNHQTAISAMPRGGDLMIRYGNGNLRN